MMELMHVMFSCDLCSGGKLVLDYSDAVCMWWVDAQFSGIRVQVNIIQCC